MTLTEAGGTTQTQTQKTYPAQAECHKVLSETAHAAAKLLGAFEPPPPRDPVACPVCPPPPRPILAAQPIERLRSVWVGPQARLPNPLFATASRERPSVFAGPAVLVSPGGLSPSVLMAMGGRLPLRSRLSAELMTFLPLTAGRVENADGAMTLRQTFFGAGIDVQLLDPDKPVMLALGAGMGPMQLAFEGKSSNLAVIGAAGARWTAFAYGRLGIGIRLHPLLRVRFDALVGPEFPEPVLRIAGRDVAHVGRPTVFLTLGAEVIP